MDDPENPNLALRQGQSRVFKTQLALCVVIGSWLFLLFCILRRKWPHMYAVRTLRKRNADTIKLLPTGLVSWVWTVWAITDDEVLEYSGLDAYVFLLFFKLGITIFLLLTILSIVVLGPIRYYNTGNYDKDNILWLGHTESNPDLSDDFPNYLWAYPFFTYVFSIIVYVKIFSYTKRVLKTRQKYLASQNSITDRTIRLDGIPKRLLKKNDPQVLKTFIEDLQIGRVLDVKLIYDYTPLENLFADREKVLRRLEQRYAQTYGLRIDLYNHTTPAVVTKHPIADYNPSNKKFQRARKEIIELANMLVNINDEIRSIQDKFDARTGTIDVSNNPDFRLLPSAFITMDSVAAAQMAAQTVLDPRVYKLMVTLAPAPKDINWSNFKLTYWEKLCKSYLITFIIIFSYAFVLSLVTPLATLLDLKTITKFWPELGDLIRKLKWLTTFVTGILPPFLFSLLNISLPYFYKYLLQFQGYPSNSDVELSTLSKNFFFIYFNLFVVFIITGTFWDYISSISDTTKLAYQLAVSLKKLSLFYVDLILLQGLAMFPVKLLQIGDFVILNVLGKLFFLKSLILRTPRDYRFYYYTPPVFDFGLHLPQHILIFIIILIYLVVSTKIVTSGLAYFTLGYFVYKYQLIYSFVHPPHSTGKVWPMIFRRVMLGLVLFQMFMCGTLALEGAILLSLLCTPLIMVTLIIAYNFERYYLPLHSFIALKAIQNPYDFDQEFDDDLATPQDSPTPTPEESGITETSSLLRQRSRRVSTVDEERERFSDYTHPMLTNPLHGPWIGFDGDYISMVEYREGIDLEAGVPDDTLTEDISVVSHTEDETVVRKRLRVSEWE